MLKKALNRIRLNLISLEKNVFLFYFNSLTTLNFNLVLKALKVEDQLKMLTNELKVTNGNDARHVKFVITEAYDSFVAIQHIRIDYAKGSR